LTKMLAPEFRMCEKIDLMKPAKNFISYNYGDNMFKSMEGEIQNIQETHNMLTQVAAHKTDSSQMKKFRELYMANYKNFSCFYKYMTFGKLKTNLDVKFTWFDSFNKEKKMSPMPLIEMYSSLYNYAVAGMREACYMDLSGDGIKTASKNFQESAWVFEYLISQVSTLPAGEATVDFSKESLSMSQNLCLAQA